MTIIPWSLNIVNIPLVIRVVVGPDKWNEFCLSNLKEETNNGKKKKDPLLIVCESIIITIKKVD